MMFSISNKYDEDKTECDGHFENDDLNEDKDV
jgi:hypothetical protein